MAISPTCWPVSPRATEERAANLRDAVAHYRDALTVYTRDRYPHAFAETMANLGMLLADGGDVEEAQRCVEEAWSLRELLSDRGERLEEYRKKPRPDAVTPRQT